LLRARSDRFDFNPKAAVFAMMRKHKSNDLLAIVDSSKRLVTDPTQLKEHLQSHFADQFATDTDSKRSMRPENRDHLFAPKPHINPIWYDKLMASVLDPELQSALQSSKLCCAPGADGVSIGLLKVGCLHSSAVRRLLCCILNACIRLRRYPTIGKHSIIVPILKKLQAEPTLDNIRPIALQASISKLLSKILASRLASIFERHPILHPAAEGFVRGGSIGNCISVFLDILELRKTQSRDCFFIAYDVSKAYDRVEFVDVIRALKRLKLPPSFIELIEDSFAGLTCCVRTAYGNSASFSITRSLRQGDPKSPLEFVIFADSLHCGIDDIKSFGFVISPSLTISSKGYADTVVFSQSLEGIIRMNDFVHEWCSETRSRLNSDKTFMGGLLADGSSFINSRVTVHGALIKCVSANETFKYLGLAMSGSLDWRAQISAMNSIVAWHCHLVERAKLTIAQAVVVFNLYLLPKLELGMRHARISFSQLDIWDKSIARSIGILAGTFMRKLKPAALAIIIGLKLPSQLDTVLKISDSFSRLNCQSQSSVATRSRWQFAHIELKSHNRLAHVLDLCQAIDFKLSAPDPRQWKSGDDIKVPLGSRLKSFVFREDEHSLALNFTGSWGAQLESLTMIACISVEGQRWAATLNSDWLLENSTEVARGTADLKLSCTVSGVSNLGNPDDVCLEACARLLFACPTSWHLIVHVLRSNPVSRWNSFSAATIPQRLRMFGHPILGTISRLESIRSAAGGSFSLYDYPLSEVLGGVLYSAAFRCSTFHLNQSPLPLTALKWEFGTPHIAALHNGSFVLSDMRRHLWNLFAQHNVTAWQSSRTQSCFASAESVELVAESKLDGGQAFCIRLLTDTLRFKPGKSDDGKSIMVEIKCPQCHDVDDALHLLTATCWDYLKYRNACLLKINAAFNKSQLKSWMQQNCPGLNLVQFLQCFFSVNNRADAMHLLSGAFSAHRWQLAARKQFGRWIPEFAELGQFVRKTLYLSAYSCWTNVHGHDLILPY
jgi:hypothetical protein